MDPLNVVVLRGRLSRPAEERIMPVDGQRLVGLDLTVRRPDAEKADSVPVIWHDPPATASLIDAGDEVVVVGHVARRFFKAGGSTQSRTEVVAHKVIPAKSAKKIAKAIGEAMATLEAALPANV